MPHLSTTGSPDSRIASRGRDSWRGRKGTRDGPRIPTRSCSGTRERRGHESYRAFFLAAQYFLILSPTAFFCAHDGLALTVVSELLRLGFQNPEDVRVVGFGDFSSATQISPQLTTVTLPGQEMGASCVRLLDDKLTGRVANELRLRITVAGRLVLRDSSGPLRA